MSLSCLEPGVQHFRSAYGTLFWPGLGLAPLTGAACKQIAHAPVSGKLCIGSASVTSVAILWSG